MGPLTTPKAFRRPTGAHAILVSLVLADVCGILFWLLLGGFLAPLIWRLLLGISPLLHASLLLDVGVVLIAACVAFGILEQGVQKKGEEEAWGCAGPLIVLLMVALPLIFLLKTSWMQIPSPIPAVTVEPSSDWPLHWSLIGGNLAAALYILAHFALWQRERRETMDTLLSYSRISPGSQLHDVLEQAYAIYRRSLTRFAHPSIEHLKTPLTFLFYPRTPQAEADAEAHPERELSWVGGELVICLAHLGPKQEQGDMLLPLLARLLHDINSPVALVERLLHLAHLAKHSPWSLVLWLPIRLARSCEQRWQALERDRVLDRDRFAWELGEGRRLRKLLLHQRATLQKTEQPDNAVPTLAERLDLLISLLRTEVQQVLDLRAGLPPASPAPPPETGPS